MERAIETEEGACALPSKLAAAMAAGGGLAFLVAPRSGAGLTWAAQRAMGSPCPVWELDAEIFHRGSNASRCPAIESEMDRAVAHCGAVVVVRADRLRPEAFAGLIAKARALADAGGQVLLAGGPGLSALASGAGGGLPGAALIEAGLSPIGARIRQGAHADVAGKLATRRLAARACSDDAAPSRPAQ